jgi:hypothetical protein
MGSERMAKRGFHVGSWGRHPLLQSPLAVRLSRLSLLHILGIYLAIAASWVTISAVALYVLEDQDRSFVNSVRLALWAAWGPGNIFGQADRPLVYYALGILNALLSVLLPVLLLGAFVFKLFQHDPLEWRQKLTVEAHPSGQFVLAARFYNRFTVDIADLRIRAWLRWTPLDNRSVRRNMRLQLLAPGQLDYEEALPLALPAEPTTVRVILGPTGNGLDPLDSRNEILVQEELVSRSDASIVLVVDGITTSSSDVFRSTKNYRLDVDVEEDLFQDIPLGSLAGKEWDNFDGTQQAYVFVYGSPMVFDYFTRASLSVTKLQTAKLKGWIRAWNVANNPSIMNHIYYVLDNDGMRHHKFEGHVVSLGLASAEKGDVTGIVTRVGYNNLAEFDLRAINYDRVDVTADIDISWESTGPEIPSRVFTYVPKKEAIDEFERLKKLNCVVVEKNYYESVRDAINRRDSKCLAGYEEVELAGIPIIRMERIAGPSPQA